MKKLFIFILLLVSASASAKCHNQLPESEVLKAIALTPGAGAVTCKQRPNEKCYCFNGIDWETASLQDVQEDDPSKPVYEAESNVQPCTDQASCSALIADQVDSSDPLNPVVTHYCPDGYTALIAADYSHAYCTRIVGYEKRTVRKLLADAAKIAAKQAREQAKADAKAAKEAERAARLAKLKAAKEKGAKNMTDSERLDLLQEMVLELLEKQ